MFVGRYSHTLDSKGRLTIPSRLRANLGETMMVTCGMEPCLAIYPLPQWERMAAKLSEMPMSSRAMRDLTRSMFGQAHEATMDKMGRILLPAFLRTHAAIEGEVIVLGANQWIELWNPERLEAVNQAFEANQEEIMGDLLGLGF